MKRQDAIAIRAELEHITNDVRDLELSPSRAAALQCLADAMMHLARIKPPAPAPLPSVPPSCAENARVRNKATEAFRNARKLLSGITLRGIAEREHEKLLDEQAEGRK